MKAEVIRNELNDNELIATVGGNLLNDVRKMPEVCGHILESGEETFEQVSETVRVIGETFSQAGSEIVNIAKLEVSEIRVFIEKYFLCTE